jgi:hypothetical protein
MTAPPEQPPSPAPPSAPVPPTPQGPYGPRRPLPPADRPAQHRAIAALLVAFLGLFGLFGLNDFSRGIYVVLYTLLAGGVALWLGITSITRARRGQTRRPRGSVPAIVLAGLGIVMSSLLLLMFAMFGKQLTVYGRCMDDATTPAGQQACLQQFDHSVTGQLEQFQSTSR